MDQFEPSAIKVLTERGTEIVGRTFVMNPGKVLTKTTAIKDRFKILGSKAWLL